jgi:hypothetical protein
MFSWKSVRSVTTNNKNLLCMHIFLINVRDFVLDVRVERVEGRSPIATLSNDMC